MPVDQNQKKLVFKEVLPKTGMIYNEETPQMALCKPKILPLKSVTLEKLEKMQKEAQEALKSQEAAKETEHSTVIAQ